MGDGIDEMVFDFHVRTMISEIQTREKMSDDQVIAYWNKVTENFHYDLKKVNESGIPIVMPKPIKQIILKLQRVHGLTDTDIDKLFNDLEEKLESILQNYDIPRSDYLSIINEVYECCLKDFIEKYEKTKKGEKFQFAFVPTCPRSYQLLMKIENNYTQKHSIA